MIQPIFQNNITYNDIKQIYLLDKNVDMLW